MKNRMTKFATAAVLIVAVLLSITLLDKTVTTPAYGLAEALQVYKQTNILHIKGFVFFVKETKNGQELRGLPYEKWIDQENGCFRKLSPAGTFGPSLDETPRHYLDVSDGRYLMETSWTVYVDASRKPQRIAQYKELSPFQQRLQMRNVQKNAMDLNYCDVAGFAIIGSEAIEGEVLDIWQGEVAYPGNAVPYKKLTVWLSATSGQIKQLKRWDNTLLNENDIHWRLGCILNFEYDATPPEGCFDTVPPPDCELENTIETAVKTELGIDDDGRVTFHTCMGFTLNDGSVILGWHAHLKDQLDQEELFKGLEPGGPLPQLPAQITELIPFPTERDVLCVGHHLAYTQKAGKFYEWGLYVPDGIYNRGPFTRLKVKRVLNKGIWRDYRGFPTTAGDKMSIDSEQEFNSWVLDAMAELSDDGKVPEDITYNGVLELAQQIRESLDE